MIRKLQIVFDILMLVLVLSAEGSRFFDFFLLLSRSEMSALIFALAVSLIIVYLAIGEYTKTSKFSVLVCIGLSVISYIDPFTKEILENDFSKIETIEKQKKEIPVWVSKWESKKDKELREISFRSEIEKVKNYNERLEKEILTVNTVSKTKMIAFLFSAFLMSFCVPLLTYLISHKLSKELTGVIHVKREKENIEKIFEKIGGKKL